MENRSAYFVSFKFLVLFFDQQLVFGDLWLDRAEMISTLVCVHRLFLWTAETSLNNLHHSVIPTFDAVRRSHLCELRLQFNDLLLINHLAVWNNGHQVESNLTLAVSGWVQKQKCLNKKKQFCRNITNSNQLDAYFCILFSMTGRTALIQSSWSHAPENVTKSFKNTKQLLKYKRFNVNSIYPGLWVLHEVRPTHKVGR